MKTGKEVSSRVGSPKTGGSAACQQLNFPGASVPFLLTRADSIRNKKQVWRREISGIARYACVHNGTLLAGGVDLFMRGWLGCYDVATGKPRWEKRGKDVVPGVVGKICAHTGGVFAAGTEVQGKEPVGNWLCRYSSLDGGQEWVQRFPFLKAPKGFYDEFLVLQVSDRVVLVGTGGPLYAWRLAGHGVADGKLVWHKESDREPIHALCNAGGDFFAVGGDFQAQNGSGWVGRFSSKTGEPLWLDSEVPGIPTCILSDSDRLFAGGGFWLACYDIGKGRKLWQHDRTHPWFVEQLAINEDVLVATGKVLITVEDRPLPGVVDTSTAVEGGWLRCYRPETGTNPWRREDPVTLSMSPSSVEISQNGICVHGTIYDGGKRLVWAGLFRAADAWK